VGFNAGEVTATLTLDREPFQRSMKEARQEVADFEKGRGVREEKVKLTGLEEAKARLKQLDQRVQANVGVKTAEARAELGALERELKKLHRKVEAHVGVEGVPKTLTEIEAVERALSKLAHREVKPKVDGNGLTRLGEQATKAGGSMGVLALAAAGLGPAIVPVAAVATAGVMGLASGLGAAAIGAGSFGLVLKTQLTGIQAFSTKIQEAQYKVNATFGPAFVKQHKAALKQLELLQRQLTDRFGPGGIAAAHAWQAMTQALQNFQQSFNPQITALIVAGTHTITTGLTLLKPVTAAAGNAFVTLAKMAGTALQSPFWKSFFGWAAREAGPAIVSLGRIIGNLAHGFAGLMMAFTPMSHGIMNGLVGMTAKFAQWATHLGSSGAFHKFVGFVRTEGPVVLHVLGDLARIIVDLVKAFAPYGAAVLNTVQHMLHLTQAFLQAHPAAARLAATLIPLALIARKLLVPFGLLVKGLGKLWEGLKVARVAMLALGGPVTIVVAAVAGLVAGAIYAYTHFKAFRDTITQVAHVFSTVLGPIVKQVGGWIKTELGAAVAWVKQHWPEISKGIVSVMTTVANVVKGVLAAVQWYWKHYGHAILSEVHGVWDIIKGVIGGAMHIIKGVVQVVLGLIHGNWGQVWKGIANIAKGAWSAITGIVSGGLRIVGALFEAAGVTIWNLAKAGWRLAVGAFSLGIKLVVWEVTKLPGKIIGALGDLGKMLWDAGKQIIQGLIDGIGSMVQSVWDKMTSIGQGIQGAVRGALGIKSPSTVFHGFGVNLMQGLRNGIHTAAPLVIAALRSVTAQMQAHMKGALAAFANRREHGQLVALDNSPQSRELAALTGARDAEAAVVQQNQDAQTMMVARMTDDPAQVAAAQKQIDARKRDERIAALTQELADKRTAITNEAASAKAGHDAQANSFVRMLGRQTDALERALAQRHVSLRRFSAQVGRLFTPLGMAPLALTGGQSQALARFEPADRHRPRLGHGGHRTAGHITEHHNYQVNVPPAVAAQNGFDARHASAQLGQALVRHGRHGRRR